MRSGRRRLTGALAADLHQDASADRMRFHDLARAAGRLDGDRRGPGDKSQLGAEAKGARGARSRLRFTGCDRTANWSTPHHIEFWSKGGPNNIANEVLLCLTTIGWCMRVVGR